MVVKKVCFFEGRPTTFGVVNPLQWVGILIIPSERIGNLIDILGYSSINTMHTYIMETGTVHHRKNQKLGLLRT